MKKIYALLVSTLILTGIHAQVKLIQVFSGDSVTLGVTSTNNVQWQVSSDKTTWNNIVGETKTKYKFLPTQDGYYRGKVTGVSCGTLYSDTVYVPVTGMMKENLSNNELANLLRQCYVSLYFWYGKEFGTLLTEGGTDIFTYGSGMLQSQMNAIKYSSFSDILPNLGGLWNELYKTVMNCNSLINYVKKSNLSAAEKIQYESEARFLRAFNQWLIVETWGGTLNVKGFEPLKASDWSLAPVDTFYAQIFRDLEYAQNNLPVSTASNTLLSKSVVDALLARMHLAKGNYSEALSYAKRVIDSNKYNFLTDFSKIWDISNRQNVEVIFALDYTGIDPSTYYIDFVKSDNPGTIQTYNGNNSHLFWGVRYDTRPGIVRSLEYGRPFVRYIPTRYYIELFNDNLDQRFEGSFQTMWKCNSSVSLPKWPATIYVNGISKSVDAALVNTARFQIGDTALLMSKNYSKAKAYTSSTPSIGGAFHPTKGYAIFDINDFYNSDGTPAASLARNLSFPMVKKFEDKTRATLQDVNSTRNYYIIRFAEICLIAAEASLKLGQQVEAFNYLSRLAYARSKTGDGMGLLSSYGINSPSDITIDFILDERARELGGEQMRWFDLKRTGKLLERVKLHNPDAALYIQTYHNLRPVPIELLPVDYGPMVVQNPGY